MVRVWPRTYWALHRGREEGVAMPRTSRFKPGEVFGRLTALTRTTSSKALYKCQCGQVVDLWLGHVYSGKTQSCGCLHHEIVSAQAKTRSTKHGMYGTRAHNTWNSMLNRCLNPNSDAYPEYGGRGITVCDEWREFANFHDDIGDPPATLTLDRRDNNLGYSKDNCRWATKVEQNNNTRGNVLLMFEGKSLNVTQWAAVIGLPRQLIYDRLRLGWSAERALTEPKRGVRK